MGPLAVSVIQAWVEENHPGYSISEMQGLIQIRRFGVAFTAYKDHLDIESHIATIDKLIHREIQFLEQLGK